jgi:LDH2 family malate/lactate/ureidoglycolate dehydrogenase
VKAAPIPVAELIAALELILQRAGCADDIALEVATALVEADLAGHGTHGARQIDFYVDRLAKGEVDGRARSEVAEDTGTLLRIAGRRAFGQVAGAHAARLGAERARQTGICLVCLAGAGHLGRNGLWAEIAAAQGVGSLHFGQGIPGVGPVAPFGGTEGRLNTNPIAFGLPGTGDDDPLILDCATSAVSGSTLKQMSDQGLLLDEPMLVRRDGAPSSNPVDFVQGLAAVIPFGGFKGYAISVFSEILSSIIAAGAAAQPATNSLLSIYFDIDRLMPREKYRAALAVWRERVTACPSATPGGQILLPGDRARAARCRGLVLTADVARHVRRAAEMLALWPEVLTRSPSLAIAEGDGSVGPLAQQCNG